MIPPLVRASVYMFFGVTGEVTFTAFKALLLKKDLRLEGYTQVWTYPMYALGGLFLFEPLHLALISYSIVLRFIAYGLLVIALEFIVGSLLKRIIGECPWEYKGKWNIGGYVSLPLIPFWGILGLLGELLHNYLLSL